MFNQISESSLKRLYFMRAILSKMSECKDKISILEERKKEITNLKFTEEDQHQSWRNELRDKYKSDLASLDTAITEIDKKIEKAEQGKNGEVSSPLFVLATLLFTLPYVVSYYLCLFWINNNFSFWSGVLFFAVAIISLLFLIGMGRSAFLTLPIGCAFIFGMLWRNSGFLIYFGIPFFICGVITVIAFIFCIVCDISQNTKKAKQQRLEQISSQLNSLSEEKARINAQKRLLQTLFDEANQKNAEELCRKNKNFLLDCQNKLNEVCQMIGAEIENFDSLYLCIKKVAVLDERDWQNLDLIIYELETGRADNMKEALQQADLYIRHDEIMDAMETATAAICSTIKESIGELSRSIGICLSGLRSELVGLRSDVSDMNQTNLELSEKFDDLVNSQELSNALLKKANVSSEKLAEDVRRMRVLRDEEYYKT